MHAKHGVDRYKISDQIATEQEQQVEIRTTKHRMIRPTIMLDEISNRDMIDRFKICGITQQPAMFSSSLVLVHKGMYTYINYNKLSFCLPSVGDSL